jgi:hypothetical protein
MKILHAFIAITATATLTTSPANAQLLGGGIGGSMSNAFGGALGGSMMGRGGAVDGRFGSDHSLRAGGTSDAQPDLSRPITRAGNATGPVIADGKQTANGAAHSAAAKADSSRSTAVNGGTIATHEGNEAATEVKSATASTARTEEANTASKAQSPVSAATKQAATGDAATRAPSARAAGDGSAANDTHVSHGAEGWSAGSQTSSGADASAKVER